MKEKKSFISESGVDFLYILSTGKYCYLSMQRPTLISLMGDEDAVKLRFKGINQ